MLLSDYSKLKEAILTIMVSHFFLAPTHFDKTIGGAGGIAAREQIYMGAPIGVVEIHLKVEIATPGKVPPRSVAPSPPPPPLCSATG